MVGIPSSKVHFTRSEQGIDRSKEKSDQSSFNLARVSAPNLPIQIPDRAARPSGRSTKLLATYSDRAKSGASIHGRQGIGDLMAAAKDRAFDVLIVESLDRLSRSQSDLAAIYDRLTFIGIDIVTVHGGRADQIALFLTDLAQNVRRGAAGNIREGKHAGGLAYG
jgi:site-specific DNA recombinase